MSSTSNTSRRPGDGRDVESMLERLYQNATHLPFGGNAPNPHSPIDNAVSPAVQRDLENREEEIRRKEQTLSERYNDLLQREAAAAAREKSLSLQESLLAQRESGGNRLVRILDESLNPAEHLDRFVDEDEALEIVNALQQRLDTGLGDVDRRMRHLHIRILGRLIHRYRVLPDIIHCRSIELQTTEHPLRNGSYADVYRGTWMGRNVAVKMLRVNGNMTEAERMKILKDCWTEAITWRQLKHANVLPFFGINTDLSSNFSLVSPWISRGMLPEFLNSYPQHERMDSIIDILNGLKYLHELDPPAVHADLRGANILVGDDHHCLLADFGISKITHTLATISSIGNTKGAVRWTPPEVYEEIESDEEDEEDDSSSSRPQYTPSRDMWSLACTVIEIYNNGPHPYAEYRSENHVILALLQKKPPKWPEDVPSGVVRLFAPCLCVERSARPSAAVLLPQAVELRAGITSDCSCNVATT